LDTNELIRRAEQELADGNRSARKTVERARRELLKKRDTQGLEQLLDLAGRLDDAGDLTYAIQQNLRFLSGQAQPAPAGPGDASLMLARRLGLVAAALAFVTSFGAVLVLGVIIGLACQGCTAPDGDWLFNSLFVTFAAAVVGSVGVAAAGRRPRLLAGVEATAAAGMVVAIVFAALDGGDMHVGDGRLDASFLYWVFALIATLFVSGAALARRGATPRGS
jgi:hypothetical protein